MKFFYRQLFVAFLLLGLAFNAKAVNDTLTRGQVYDFSVGDTFDYKYTTDNPNFGIYHTWYYRMAITSKYTSAGNDTVIYGHATTYSYNDTVWHFDSTTYTGLDSFEMFTSRYFCDTPYCSATYFFDTSECLNLSRNSFSMGGFEHWGSHEFTQGLGITKQTYIGHTEPLFDFDTTQLIYFSKSGIQCGTPYTVFSIVSSVNTQSTVHSPFSISPNPATSELTITADNQTPVSVSIYSATGVLMGSYQKPASGAFTISVNNLPPAYYLLKLTGSDGLSACKSFIVAR